MTDPRLPEGYRLERLASVGSTNAVAFERADAGAASGLWIVADRQTAGRGRQGRVWTSEPGNLYSSLMLRETVSPDRFGELPLIVALAAHDAVSDALPPTARADLAIKWPNDLLYAGAKLAGILIEGAVREGGGVLVVGIGVNCRHHPDTTLYPATDLLSLGQSVAPGEMLELLADHLDRRLAAWRDGAFPALREAWIARAAGIGQPIAVRLAAGTRQGVFDGLDAMGRLLLRTEGRTEAIAAGDVFLG